jgi:hypothetical protein
VAKIGVKRCRINGSFRKLTAECEDVRVFRLIQHLDLRKGVYGFVGMSDRTMYPIIRPGSIVQIHQNQRKIPSTKRQNEHERQIYFIELRW